MFFGNCVKATCRRCLCEREIHQVSDLIAATWYFRIDNKLYHSCI